jgi:hypothetical protein
VKERLEKLGHKIDDIGEGKGFYCKKCDCSFFRVGTLVWAFSKTAGFGSYIVLPTCNELIIKSIIE